MALQWVKCSYGDKESEFEKTAKKYSDDQHLKVNIALIKKQYSISKQISLTNAIWSKMKNTNSYNTKTIEDMQAAIKIAKESKDITSILKEFFSGKVESPIAMRLGDGSYELISGSSRLMAARVLGITPKIQIVDINW